MRVRDVGNPVKTFLSDVSKMGVARVKVSSEQEREERTSAGGRREKGKARSYLSAMSKLCIVAATSGATAMRIEWRRCK
jgi:hypothetical protein